MSHKDIFISKFNSDPIKVYGNKMLFRASDLDSDRAKANQIVQQENLNLRVYSDASSVQCRSFIVEEI